MKNFIKKLFPIYLAIALLGVPCLADANYFTLPVNIDPDTQITSWFDHDMTASTSMTKYTGEIFLGAASSLSDCSNPPYDGSGCYNGHNGIDFDGDTGDDILAPYNGQVVERYETCAGLTMHLWHDDIGLSTLYAHLDSYVSASGTAVERFEHIAEMGETGDPGCVNGAHLHFGVTDSDDMAGNRLDPFGWSGTTTDPWSYNQGYLWTTDPSSFEVPTTWYDSNWDYRIKVTVDHTKVSDDLKGFPVYVNLSDLPSDFHTHVRTDGGDIRVTKADGHTELPREVVSYSAGTDSGELYFRSTLISPNVDTVFYVYYGNSAATDYSSGDTYGRNAV